MYFTPLGLIALSLCSPQQPVTRLWLSADAEQAIIRYEPVVPGVREFLDARHYHTDSSSGPAYLAGSASKGIIDGLRLTYNSSWPFAGSRSA